MFRGTPCRLNRQKGIQIKLVHELLYIYSQRSTSTCFTIFNIFSSISFKKSFTTTRDNLYGNAVIFLIYFSTGSCPLSSVSMYFLECFLLPPIYLLRDKKDPLDFRSIQSQFVFFSQPPLTRPGV